MCVCLKFTVLSCTHFVGTCDARASTKSSHTQQLTTSKLNWFNQTFLHRESTCTYMTTLCFFLLRITLCENCPALLVLFAVSLASTILMLFGVAMTALVLIGVICFCRKKFSPHKPAKPKRHTPQMWNVKKTIEIVHPHLAGRPVEGVSLVTTSETLRVDNDYATEKNSTVIANPTAVLGTLQTKEGAIKIPPPLPPPPSNRANQQLQDNRPCSSPQPHHHYNDLDAELGSQKVFKAPVSSRPHWILARNLKPTCTKEDKEDGGKDHVHVNINNLAEETSHQEAGQLTDNQGYELPAENFTDSRHLHQTASSASAPTPSKHSPVMDHVQLFASASSTIRGRSMLPESSTRHAFNPLYNPQATTDNLSIAAGAQHH